MAFTSEHQFNEFHTFGRTHCDHNFHMSEWNRLSFCPWVRFDETSCALVSGKCWKSEISITGRFMYGDVPPLEGYISSGRSRQVEIPGLPSGRQQATVSLGVGKSGPVGKVERMCRRSAAGNSTGI
jgi:hypothetical protein